MFIGNITKKTDKVITYLTAVLLILFNGCGIGPQVRDVATTTPTFYQEDKVFFLKQLGDDERFSIEYRELAHMYEVDPQERHFEDSNSINLKLLDVTPDLRAGAVRELIDRLDDSDSIDCSGCFEQGRIRISEEIADKTWHLDYHLVWPEPTAGSPQLNSVKLINYVAAGGNSPDSGATARRRAHKKFGQTIASLVAPGGSLIGRIDRLSA